MRIYGEVVFDVAYLVLAVSIGINLVRSARGDRLLLLFGAMALVLGIGDAFHLVPRVHALLTTGQALNTPALGFGKLVTSVTMTIFYLMLYRIWQMKYGVKSKLLSGAVVFLAALRIGLCFSQHNQWFAPEPPLLWGIIRNIPFAILGALIVVIFWQKRDAYPPFRFLWLAVLLSFAFYIPVVLFADSLPAIGVLMLPKTACYVWILCMGLLARRANA